MSVIDSIIWYPLPPTCYVPKSYKKETIWLHHTASDGNARNVISYWAEQRNQVSATFTISREASKNLPEASIVQAYNSQYCSWHLGLSEKNLIKGGKSNTFMNFAAIPIEVCNYGPLIQKGEKFVSYDGTIIPETDIYEFDTPYRHYKYYQKYLNSQLEVLAELLKYLSDKYNISLKNSGIAIFDINRDALTIQEYKLYSHTSVRPYPDKFDMFPQPELLDMLASLN